MVNSILPQSIESNANKTIIQWKSVENAASYKLEIRLEDAKQMQLNLKENEVSLDLKPGKYEYRVGALNKFKKVKHWSKWFPLEVVYSQPPVINEDSKYSFSLPEKEQEIVVKGKYFLEEIEVELESNSNKLPVKNIKRISDTELRFSVDMESYSKAEKIRLTLRNPLNKITVKESFIVLEEKPKAKEAEVAVVEERGSSKPEEPNKTEPKELKENRSYSAEVLPPLWRSSLVPGWGQYYKGEKTKAYIVGGSVLFFLGSVFFFESFKDYSVSRSERYSNLLFLLPGDKNLLPAALYLRSESIHSRQEAQDNLQRQEAVLGVAAAIYLYNIADILWNRKSTDKIIDPNEKTSGLFLNMGNQGRGSFQFGFSYRF
jgi:hypothetical protein